MNLITGATGFIGMGLLNHLIEGDFHVAAAVRVKPKDWSIPCQVFELGEIGPATSWSDALFDVDTVIHTAARVHVMNDSSSNPLEEFRRVNVAGTLNLARQAAKAGVKKFIFLSSIKVNGEFTKKGRAFTEFDPPCPEDAYGISKYEAEVGLRLIARNTKMKVTIIRPVLVYGPGVKGNLLSLFKLQRWGIPLPLGAIQNARSFISLYNLINFIEICLNNPATDNEIFLVSDGEDISVTQLLRLSASAMNTKSRLIPVPMGIVEYVARLLGKKDMATRLCSNLQVDISKSQKILGWSPPLDIKSGLERVFRNELG